ncbi:MAG: OmpA family protein [Bacteroidota bacterium]|nr:OmpA family protein [Bacteroidota bacterium]
MMKKKYYLLIFLSIYTCVFNHSVSAQVGMKGYIKKADALFAQQNYYASSKLYEAVLTGVYDEASVILPYSPNKHKHGRKAKGKTEEYVLWKLAESYRLFHDYEKALTNYQKYKRKAKQPDPKLKLYMAVCLRANDEADIAIPLLTDFLNEYDSTSVEVKQAKIELNNCYFILEQKSRLPLFAVTKLREPVNTDGSNYAMDKISDKLFLFSTSRTDTTLTKELIHPSRIMMANSNFDSEQVLFPSAPLDMAASSLSPDSLTLYFTGWHETYIPSKNNYALYYLTRNSVSAPWSEPVMMDSSVNAKGFNSKQPFITADNKHLLFVSDRPGGLGKYDIWMIEMNDGKTIGTAINLGDSINTAEDEAAPFYNEELHRLFFSSNGRKGMGGMDIYQDSGIVASNEWREPVNLGFPLNSVKDDVYYKRYHRTTTDTAFFSSDRASSCCLEVFMATPVQLKDSTADRNKSDSIAKAQQLLASADSLLVAKKEVVTISKEEEAKQKRQLLLDSLNQSTVFRYSIHFDFNRYDIRRNARSTIDTVLEILKGNPEYNVVIASFTDCKGSTEVNLRLSKARSNATKAYLRKHHINATRINTDFFGEEHLLLPCKDDTTYNVKEQSVNRRSDIIITKNKNAKWTPTGKELDIDEILDDIRNGKRPFHFRSTDERYAKRMARIERNRRLREAREKALNEKRRLQKELKVKSERERIERKQRLQREKQAHTIDRDHTAKDQRTKNEIHPSEDDVINNKDKMIATLDSISQIKSQLLVKQMTSRVANQVITLYTNSDSVHIDIYDNGVFDNDSISVIYDKKIVAYKKLLKTDEPISFNVPVEPGENKNEMIFYAENLGTIPPNSALMVITDGDGKRTEVSVVNNLQHNTVIYFVKLKKK